MEKNGWNAAYMLEITGSGGLRFLNGRSMPFQFCQLFVIKQSLKMVLELDCNRWMLQQYSSLNVSLLRRFGKVGGGDKHLP